MDLQEARERLAIQVLSETTEASGNSRDLNGKPITADDIIDLVESIQGGFDEDGNPHPVQIVAGSEAARILKSIPWTPQNQKRLEEVRAQKKETYLASQRTRRLAR
ncbi:MAG: hypothetical protein AB7G88_14070 [Thermomicrobiales bacterium]